MTVSDLITFAAVTMAFLSLVIAALSYVAAQRMARANEEMAKANREMARAADLAAQSARELAGIEAGRDRTTRAANLVLRHDNRSGVFVESAERLSYDRNRFSSLPKLGLCVVNKGPVDARDVELTIRFDAGVAIGPSKPQVIESGEWACPNLEVRPSEFGERIDRIAQFQLSYRDNTGPNDVFFKVKVQGIWDGYWKTMVLNEG